MTESSLPSSPYSSESYSDDGNSTSNVSEFQDEAEDAYNWGKYLIALGGNITTYLLPVIIIAGTVGNVLSIATLRSKYFRRAPCTVLLLALAVVDTLMLTFCGSNVWLKATFGFHWKSLTQRYWLKRQLYCARQILVTLSPWTVVLITSERFILVMCPFRAGTLCSRKRMAISWCVMALVIVLTFGCTDFLCTGQDYNNYCSEIDSDVIMTFYRPIYFTVTCAVPFLLIVGGNACIIYKTILAHRKRTQTMVSSSSASAASNTRALTTMLLAVCIVFVLTVFPLQMLNQVWIYMKVDPVLGFGLRHLLASCFLILYFTNSATNFILYLFWSTQFRKAFLKRMCRC